MQTQANNNCYWDAAVIESVAYPALAEHVEADVLIVGAGIVGLSTAQALSQSGKSVIVVEALRIGHQATGRSTAKVTSQHGPIYAQLISDLGQDRARIYAKANQDAIERISALAQSMQTTCAFERKSAYIYAQTEKGAKQLKQELEAATQLGLPARLVTEIPANINIKAALCFDNQAQFHPVQYLKGLATLVSQTAQLYENTRIVEVSTGDKGDKIRCSTDGGFSVTAKDVIIATHLPTVPQGMFFSKAYTYSHSVVAAPLSNDIAPDGMFISIEKPTYSFRVHEADGVRHLIAVGPTFGTGVPHEETDSFHKLAGFMQENFGIDETPWRWTNEDFEPMDGLPFVGRASSGTPHLYVATGFNAWGITTGTVAASVLSDLVMGRENPCSELFDATRLKPLKGGPEFIKENLKAAKHMVADRLGLDDLVATELAAGQAKIAKMGDEKVAAYRDPAGTVHMVSAVCTHMGCLVGWNATDRSWDCPCHGSRFGIDGSVIHGPATTPLKPLNSDPENDAGDST